MNFFLRPYQTECLEMVSEKLNKGYRYLSVVMPVGTGKTVTSLFLVQRLHEQEQAKIAIVCRMRMIREQTEQTARQLGMDHAEYFTVRRFLRSEDIDTYQYLILHDLSVAERKQVLDRVRGSKVRTISFFDPVQETVGKNGTAGPAQIAMPDPQRLSKIVCVFVTEDVLDIRDAKYIGESALGRVRLENDITVDWILRERDNSQKERDAAKRQQDQRLSFYQDKLYQTEDRTKMQEQEAEIARLKALLEEKEARIAMQDQLIEFQQDVLSGFGIDAKIIRDSFEQIQQVRTSLRGDLESNDPEVQEIALKKLQDTVSEIVSTLSESALSSQDQQYFGEYLAGELSEDVWERLESKSRTFLITAKSSYESMIKMPERETLDYSGVCLLVTKALEVETAKRFFDCYKGYLERECESVSEWPYALRQRIHGRITDQVISDNDFTLGSVVSVTGHRREHDEAGTIVGYPVKHAGAKNRFLDFALQELFVFSDRQRAEEAIERDFRFIEKVRVDYRNPSAHRSRLTITSAKDCLEYVIEVQQMLKIMLQEMKI